MAQGHALDTPSLRAVQDLLSSGGGGASSAADGGSVARTPQYWPARTGIVTQTIAARSGPNNPGTGKVKLDRLRVNGTPELVDPDTKETTVYSLHTVSFAPGTRVGLIADPTAVNKSRSPVRGRIIYWVSVDTDTAGGEREQWAHASNSDLQTFDGTDPDRVIWQVYQDSVTNLFTKRNPVLDDFDGITISTAGWYWIRWGINYVNPSAAGASTDCGDAWIAGCIASVYVNGVSLSNYGDASVRIASICAINFSQGHAGNSIPYQFSNGDYVELKLNSWFDMGSGRTLRIDPGNAFLEIWTIRDRTAIPS